MGLGRSVATAGAAAAALAAGAAAGLVAERVVVGRSVRSRGEPQFGFGTLHSPHRIVTADDGVQLYVEVDEPGPRATWPQLTVIFSHGFALNLDSWHFQREALRGRARLVFYDQRSHGRSGRGPVDHATIDQLGSDLAAVIDAVAPDSPVVLVGHSMGGMTVMALARHHHQRFGEHVVGVVLLATSSGRLAEVTLGVPALFATGARRIAPRLARAVQANARLVERGRRVGSDLVLLLTRTYAFASRDVPSEIVDFAAEMIEGTPSDVLAEFYPAIDAHEALDDLQVLDGVDTLVIVGQQDLVTPASHSLVMVQALPHAELVLLDPGGHLVMLERPDDVNAALDDFLTVVAEHTS
jgi:pimeloyl-ACP methyl ester carboxylesterase